MDESTTYMPAPERAANDAAGPEPQPPARRPDDGPDGLFNHYRLRRLRALGVPPAPAENAA
ncbi:hypothetical protein E7V67_000350 [[Empedobacter] haloabium]|uniref:Uncharacterized protein n=1 Tax=[Empedobacter] haloabium TaxID=592317 RepID=A0ABZ1UND9_9BURK